MNNKVLWIFGVILVLVAGYMLVASRQAPITTPGGTTMEQTEKSMMEPTEVITGEDEAIVEEQEIGTEPTETVTEAGSMTE